MSTKCPPPHLRGAAEKQLAESSPSEVSARSDKELLHELQVHQIELEMQSEALIEAHLALEESRARFVDLYDFAPVGYLTITDKGFIAEINLAGAALLGAERCNLLQHRFSPFVVLDDGDRWRSHFLGVLKTGEKRTCELALKRVDGSHVHVRLDSVRLIKVAQTPALRVVLTDITERKQREIALCDERERIATILDTVGDPIFVKDNDHRIVLANHAFYDIFGLDKDNVIGKTLAEEVPDDEKQHFLGVDRRVLDTGEPDQREETLTSNGLSRTIITRKSRFVEGSGEKFLVGSIHDITEHKQAEEEQASLSQRLLLATSSAALGVWDWNVRENTMAWDDRMFELYGITREASPNNADAWINGLHPEDKETAIAECQAALRGEKEFDTVFRVLQPNGTVKYLKANGLVMRDADGTAIRMLGINADITETKRTELQILSLNADLEERVRQRTADLETANQLLTQAKTQAEAASIAKSTFLANMSHEIRTPMNGILGMANILRQEGVSPKQAQRLDTIDTSAQHLLSVINDVLDISKIEAGKFVLEEAPVVVSSLMANVSSILSERVKAKGIHLLIQTESLPTNLVGDPTRLQQSLLNYAANAIKFTEAGTVTLRTVKQEESIDELVVRFEVTDTGIGIAPESLSRLFSAFEQADNSMTRKYGGTGLGLAIARRLAELMGGEAGAESTLGVGSTFWFTVKLKKRTERRQTERLEKVAEVDAKTLLKQRYFGQRILVVDDDPVNREVAKMQLEFVELDADTAEDGAEAVAMADQSSYAAIFMDMQMPKLNGLDATQQIRRLPGYRDTPIIAMTANAFSEDKVQCLAAGMNEFLIKPFNPDQLFATLLRSLSRRDG